MRETVLTELLSRKVVWPDKCYCTGVHVAPIVEMLNASPVATRPASMAQVSDQPPQTFKESLLAVSRASSDAGSVHEDAPRTGRRQSPALDDRKSAHAALHSSVVVATPPQQTVQQQVPLAQQLPVIDPAPIVPPQLPPGGTGQSPKAVTVAVDPTREGGPAKLPSIGSNVAQAVVVKPDNIPSVDTQEQGDPPPVASMVPSVTYDLQTATKLSPAVTSANPDSLVTTVPSRPSNIAPSGVADSTHSLVPDIIQTVLPAIAPGGVLSAAQIPASGQPTFSISSTIQQPHLSATPGLAPGTPAQTATQTVTKSHPDAAPHVIPAEVSTVVQKSTSSSSATVPSDTTPVPISHGGVNGSAKGDVAQKTSPVSGNQANPPAPPPSPDGSATLPSVPGATADQLATLIQANGPMLVTTPAHVVNMMPGVQEKPSDGAVVDRKDGAGNSIHEATGQVDRLRHHRTLSLKTPRRPAIRARVAPPSQGRTRPRPSSTSQITPSLPLITPRTPAQPFCHHPLRRSPASPIILRRRRSQAFPAPIVVPQAVPVINTAKLIQSMGQSEMRVGMRSTDFGNISISTSATRDLISAQISLDHGELARTLATHLPEMQAKFGGDQAMNVRIDMNGQQPTGQGAGTSAGMSNGSADQSRGDRQQRGSGTSRQSGDVFAGQLNSISTAVLPSAESRLDLRLDIRV